jgi:hypothetical protein
MATDCSELDDSEVVGREERRRGDGYRCVISS